MLDDEFYGVEDKTPERLTGYEIHRGMMRLLMLFSASFCCTVLVRIFPSFQAALWILAGTGLFGLLAYIFIRKGDQSLQLLLIAIALFGGGIGGSWDALQQLQFDKDLLLPVGALTGIVLFAIGIERSVSRKQKEERYEF